MNPNQHLQPPVAIIGIGCIFAKSPDLKAFLHLLTRGISGITDPPPTHQHLVAFFDPDPKKADHIYCNRGGFLPSVNFDPTEFNIPPNVIEATDTSQLLGLLTAKRALDDAGYGENGKSFDRSRASVILGVTGTQELVIPLGARLGHPLWKSALSESGVPDDQAEQVIRRISDGYVGWQENSFPGLLGNVVAGRIANRLDLGGTNCVVDAACASSMGAIHMALLELASGRSDMVITGGVDTINDAFMHMCFSKTQILSASGDIRPFSKDADGTVLGEGIGLLVLKRAEDAEKDGDRIYAVIKGLGSASDGRSQSIYAPRPKGQARALRRAYLEADADPTGIGLVEAHGTGTRVGDQVEFKALCDVFGAVSPNGNRCALGSVKSNIGHTKAAAGSAGLIKAALSINHKVLPPTLKAESVDPKLGVEHSPFYINTKLRPWISPEGRKRKAGVSAFGFGGSNFHAVLEEYSSSKQEPSWDGSVEIAAFSGPDKQDLAARIEQWSKLATLNANHHAIGKLAKQSRRDFRSTDPQRLVMVLSLDDGSRGIDRTCRQALLQLAQAGDSAGDAVFVGSGPRTGKLAYLFPGQGSQYVGMGRDLICCFPQSLEVFEDAAATLRPEVALDEYVYPRMSADTEHYEKQLRQTHIAQPAIGAVSVGMLKALAYFGLAPDATCGHSFGELVALHAAGWMSQSDLWRLAADRGRLMAAAGQTAGETGTMLAVKAPIEEIEQLIGSLDGQGQIILANKNSPRQGVLSGTLAAIESAAQACKAKGWSTVKLPVAAGFHSHLVAEAQKPFEAQVRSVQFTPGTVSVMSNTMGGTYPEGIDAVQATLGRQLACPVDFLSNVQSLYQQGVRVFVEVGPKTVLTDLVPSILDDKDVQAMAADRSKGRNSGIFDLACTLSHLASLGFDVRLDRWEKPQSQRRTPRMAIALSGANYRSPQTAKETAESRPNKKTDPSITIDAAPYHPKSDAKAPPRPAQASAAPKQSMNTIMKPKMNEASKTVLQGALTSVQQGLASLQALQSQTAQAHQKFLETQAQASRTLQMMIQSTQQLAASAASGIPMHPTFSQPAVPLAEQEPTDRIAASKTAWADPDAKRPQPDAAPAPSETPPESTVHPAGRNAGGDIQRTLLALVSQLTGYPAEMLGLEMDIESDLGIDSIKRVEILSAMEEKMPHLPQVTPDMMGTLKTLGQICDYLSASKNPIDPPEALEDKILTEAPGDFNSSEIQGQLVAIVSQLTGYPIEMLGLEMDIESDLGIDSIKRVEILSALEEKMPDLPKVTPDMMGSLKTLGQICEYLAADPAPVSKAPSHSGTRFDAQLPASMGEETQRTLIGIVSQLTGYPIEMLGLEMDIESDLGIDSIKRVEILSALEEKMPDLPKVTPDMMGSLKTLGQIIAYLNEPGQESADRPIQPKSASEVDVQAVAENVDLKMPGIDRQIIQVRPLANPTGNTLVLPAKHFIGVAGTLDDLGAELIKALNARGLAARPLNGPEQIAADLPLAGLVLLAPVDAAEAFRWAQACAPLLKTAAETAEACFITVSSLDGAFGFNGGKVIEPSQGALAGLAKTASIEWPRVRCLALDCDPDWRDIPALAHALVDEIAMARNHREAEIGLALDRRIGLRLCPAPLPMMDKIRLTSGDVVIVTGGARGVTAEAAKALAAQAPCTLALLGRSPSPQPEPAWLNSLSDEGQIKKAILTHQFSGQTPTPREIEKQYRYWSANRQIQATLNAMQKLGVSAKYYAVDVNDAAAVLNTLNRIREELGAVKALIHGAGVLEDRLIVDKQLDQFNKVYHTKVGGLLNLLAGLGDAALDYLVLFSSVSARIGNQGQVDYAMANEVLNKIARQQAQLRPQCKVLAINWGPWDGGMVTPALKRSFLKNKVALIAPDQGASAMLAEMANSCGQEIEMVIGGLLNQPAFQERQGQSGIQPSATPGSLSLTCKREVDVAHHPVLQSHLLDGRPVVPLALIAEWLAHSALHANPGLTLHGMDNLRLFSGITLDSQKRNIRMLAGKACRNGRVYEVDVEIRDDQREGPGRVHSSARAILTDHLPAAPLFEENGHFKTNGRKPPSLEDIYQRVLFHGQDLHGIQEIIRISEEGISARLASAPPPAKWMKAPLRSRWIADPLILDCAFQMAIIWCHEQLGQVSLPSFAAAYRQYCDRFPQEGVTAVLEVNASNERKLTGDFTFLDQHKKVLAHLKGYEAIMAPELFKAFKAA